MDLEMPMSPTDKVAEFWGKYPGKTAKFHELLNWHITNGTRASGKTGMPWGKKELGVRVTRADRSEPEHNVSNWCSGRVLPNPTNLESLVDAFFTDDPNSIVWKEDFFYSYNASKEDKFRSLAKPANLGAPVNHLERAVNLIVHQPPQGWDDEGFHLLVDLFFDVQTKNIEGILFGFGLKKADLVYKFRGCVPEWGTRLGSNNFVEQSGDCWHIFGPVDPTTKVLKGNPLGYEALCRVRRLSGTSTLGVWLTVNAYEGDMKVILINSGSEVLSNNKRAVLEKFVSVRLLREDGTYELSSHGLVYGANE